MPKSFLQYLKEEEQQTTLGGWWFRARNTWGGSGQDQNAGAPAVLGSNQSWGGSVFVRMLNMPQFMLDMFDYNGDGTIGDNDQELIFQIAELAFEIYEETGEYPPPITAADYLENWEYYSELYGKDFPEPIGFIERPGGEADRPDTLFPSNVSGDSLYALLGIASFISSNFVVYGPEFFQQYHPEFYEAAIRAYDFNGDGVVDTRTPNGTTLKGDALALFFIIGYYQSMGQNLFELPGDLVTAENFLEFANNILMFGDKSLEDYIPDGYNIDDDFLATIVPDYPTSPPPPPEEIPQNQAPPPQIGGIG